MNAVLVLDKPAGMTSHDVVAIVRRATGERSVGHLGTLDPMATGVLPLLLGKYTRLAQFFGDAEKEYVGRIRFGWATDTYDAEGEAVGVPQPLTKTLDELRELALHFDGEMDQMPPVYSAKKINGVPAHALARAGAEAPVKAARIAIHRFTLDELHGEEASFRIRVSAGGYVRSVAHELGAMAGCGAHLSSLRRVSAGMFDLSEAITMDRLKELAGEGAAANGDSANEDSANGDSMDGGLGVWASAAIHPRRLLDHMPAVTVDEQTAGRLRNGMQANLPEFSAAPMLRIFTGPTELFGIGRRIAGTLVQPTVVLG